MSAPTHEEANFALAIAEKRYGGPAVYHGLVEVMHNKHHVCHETYSMLWPNVMRAVLLTPEEKIKAATLAADYAKVPHYG